MSEYHKPRIEQFATQVSNATGSSWAFLISVSLVLVWLMSGPFFNYSTNRQLVVNTGTTIITFLMVFLIQKTANKDNLAIQLKLNELIACTHNASNRVIDVEDLSEEELNTMHKFYQKLTDYAKADKNLHMIYSIDSAKTNHTRKKKMLAESEHISQLLESILSAKQLPAAKS